MAEDSLSDFLAPALQIGSTVLGGTSQVAKGIAQKNIAKRRQQELEFEATQLDQDAGQSEAVAQRKAEDIQRQTTLINSAALAKAAASGAGASDPTVLKIMARTAQEGDYRRQVALYEGEEQARMDRQRAAAQRFEGATGVQDADQARQLSNIGAASTVLAGAAKATTMYDKYWSGPSDSGDVTEDDNLFADLFD